MIKSPLKIWNLFFFIRALKQLYTTATPLSDSDYLFIKTASDRLYYLILHTQLAGLTTRLVFIMTTGKL